MGVIQRQGIKKTLVSFVGAFIGAFTNLIVAPLVQIELGLIRFVLSVANLGVPFANLGINIILLKYFPKYREKFSYFLTLLLIASHVAFILFCVITFFFYKPIISYYTIKYPNEYQYLFYTIPIIYCLVHINFFTYIAANFQRVVIPSILHDLTLKLALPIILLLYYFNWVSLNFMMTIWVVIYIGILIALILYANALKPLQLKYNQAFLKEVNLKEMGTYSGFGVLGSLGAILAFQLDTFMVGTLIELRSTSIYTISLFITNIIEIPYKSIRSIATPIIAQASSEEDYTKLNALYKKTSLNLIIIGIGLLLLLHFNIGELFNLLPGKTFLSEGLNVILILGLAKIVDMGTSINSDIINFSKYFRFNLYAVLTLSVLNIFLNILMVQYLGFGIEGVALATFIALLTYNVAKVSYAYYRFKIHPFSQGTLKVLALTAMTFIILNFLPYLTSSVLNIVLRSSIILLFFGGGILYFQVSNDISNFVNQTIKKIFKRTN